MRFSPTKLSDVLGTYAGADASAGAVKSGTAQVLTKGEVSLRYQARAKVLISA